MSSHHQDAGERIDERMERASAALQRARYFECELLAADALRLAHAEHDYQRMARILHPLQECRRQRRLAALDENTIIILEEPIPLTELALEPGCWLVCPPLVGMDGANLRERSLAEQTPMLIVTREPATRSGAWPLVAVGPRIVRIKAKAPTELSPAWFIDAIEALSEEALSTIDASLPAWERVDDLMDALMTIPESETIHQALERACHEAALEPATPAAHPDAPSVDPQENGEG